MILAALLLSASRVYVGEGRSAVRYDKQRHTLRQSI
jgi:hypothetical protein